MWLGCYGGAMRRPWDGVVVAGASGYTFQENGPFTSESDLARRAEQRERARPAPIFAVTGPSGW
jgi:hypothetical protein